MLVPQIKLQDGAIKIKGSLNNATKKRQVIQQRHQLQINKGEFQSFSLIGKSKPSQCRSPQQPSELQIQKPFKHINSSN